MNRYRLLDALRGVAALAVVVWHWQHFFYSPLAGRIVLPDRSVQPLYPLFWGVYAIGDVAVDLFFTLSGFIFFYLYAERIRKGAIGLREFSVLRLSRLYPLHLVTLLIVAGLQLMYRQRHGVDFIYPANDPLRFVQHLAFASNWGLDQGFSFNAPVWSVSIEILLYAAFFFCCRQRWFGPTDTLLVAALASPIGATAQGRGFFSFFLGGAVFYASRWVQSLDVRAQGRIRGVSGAVAVLSLATLWTGVQLELPAAAAWALQSASLPPIPIAFPTWGFVRTIVFPALIVFLVLSETRAPHLARRLGWLGDITYSSYLLHFPLQLVVVLTVGSFLDFTSGWTMLGFLAILMALSTLCYHWFERPMQSWLRQRFGSRPSVAVSR